MKKITNIIAGFALYIICAILFMGYGHKETHPYLNEIIVLKFLEKVSTGAFPNKDKLKNYEFNWNNTEQPSLTGPACGGDALFYSTMPADIEESHTPMTWISVAGWMEDVPWGPASLCHFYDPLSIDGFLYITDCSGLLESVPVLNQVKEYASIDALTWATDDSRHPYTWKIAKENIVKALKEPNPELRKQYMALAYRCLGQVLHLVCDMGCTPHVRNDSHPPNMFYVIGDPDPYEDITKKLSVSELWKVNPPDENFVNEVSSTEKFAVVFHKMAYFTNERFFSGQTIYTDRIKPVLRPNNPYPSPIVTEAEYNKKEYAYYKNYDGVNVKMCKDKVPIPFQFIFGKDSLRGRPYLDYECVKSIASAIYPNLAEAGANVIKLFIPALKVEITEAKTDSGGVIRGKVSYTIPSVDDEYYNLFDLTNTYNGPVSLFVNNSDTQIKVNANKNKFEFKLNGKLSNLKKDDGAITKIEFGGIVLKSDSKKLTSTGPIITSITPAKGKVGDEITIQGTNFGSDKTKGEVHFAGVVIYQQSITSWSDNQIKVNIPDLAITGNLKIKVNQDFSNELYFAVPPIISNLSKTTGSIGGLVTINGSKFGSTRSDGSVEFNGAPCTEITSWNDTKIEAKVPSNATSGDVIVKVKGELSNKINFQIVGPQITSIDPGSAKVGDVIFIYGIYFGNDKSKGEVFFNSIKASEISSWTNTSISVKVPTGATSGNIVVRVDGVQSNQYLYNITEKTPQINYTNPSTSGQVGSGLEISGINFGNDKTIGKVDFNGTAVNDTNVLVWTDTRIVVRIPKVKSDSIHVIVNGVRSNGHYFKVIFYYYQLTDITTKNTNASETNAVIGTSVFGDNFAEFTSERKVTDPYVKYGKYTVKGSWTIPPEKFYAFELVETKLTAELISSEGDVGSAPLNVWVAFGGYGVLGGNVGVTSQTEKKVELTVGIKDQWWPPYTSNPLIIKFEVWPHFDYLGGAMTTYTYEKKEE
jgi:hypothetical protein